MEKRKKRKVGRSALPGGYYIVPAVVMRNKVLTQAEKMVLCYYLSLWESLEAVYPSNRVIGEMTGLKTRAVQYAKVRLQGFGLITIDTSSQNSCDVQVNEDAVNRFLGCEYFQEEKTITEQTKVTMKKAPAVSTNGYKKLN